MVNTLQEEKKSKKVHQSFALGALIMAVGMLIVKLAGAAFKIPLAYILGGVGQGYFNIAYSLYNPLSGKAVYWYHRYNRGLFRRRRRGNRQPERGDGPL